MVKFKLTDEHIDQISRSLDETGGFLIKESELRFWIEKFVNEDTESLREKLQKYQGLLKGLMDAVHNHLMVMDDTEDHLNEDGIPYDDYKKLKEAHDNVLIVRGFCPECQQLFAVHNDDGSCVED